MATLVNLRTETQNLLDDTAADRWTSADIGTYLNEAQVEFSRLSLIYILASSAGSFTTTLNVASYVVQDSVGNNQPAGPVIRVENAAGKELFHTSEEVLDNLQDDNWKNLSAATARAWLRGKYGYAAVRLFPTPATTGVVYTAYFPGFPVTMVEGGQNSVIPEHYTYALPYYAAHKCLARNMDFQNLELSTRFKARFDEVVAQAKAEAERSLRL